MTEFEKGDRVKVAFEGVVSYTHETEREWFDVITDELSDIGPIDARYLTLIAKPLEVGDVIDDESEEPEPALLTIVAEPSGVAWQKSGLHGRWYSGGSMPKNSLAELARTRGPLTVRYVP